MNFKRKRKNILNKCKKFKKPENNCGNNKKNYKKCNFKIIKADVWDKDKIQIFKKQKNKMIVLLKNNNKIMKEILIFKIKKNE